MDSVPRKPEDGPFVEWDLLSGVHIEWMGYRWMGDHMDMELAMRNAKSLRFASDQDRETWLRMNGIRT